MRLSFPMGIGRQLCALLMISVGLGWAGCHVPEADISTVQDAKHPLDKQSKIAFPAAETVSALAARLADEDAQKQMRALGFNLVPPDQADYLAKASTMPRDTTVVADPGGPSFGTAVGSGGRGMFTGIGVGIPLGSPDTEVIHRTELDMIIETVQSPQLIVWQGKIVADRDDVEKYHGPFFRALLSRVGATYNGTIRLDHEDEVAPKP